MRENDESWTESNPKWHSIHSRHIFCLSLSLSLLSLSLPSPLSLYPFASLSSPFFFPPPFNLLSYSTRRFLSSFNRKEGASYPHTLVHFALHFSVASLGRLSHSLSLSLLLSLTTFPFLPPPHVDSNHKEKMSTLSLEEFDSTFSSFVVCIRFGSPIYLFFWF